MNNIFLIWINFTYQITDFTFKLKNGTTLPKGLSQIAIGSDKNITFVYGEPSSSPTVSIENVDELGDFNALLGNLENLSKAIRIAKMHGPTARVSDTW